jgi:hypothetical protein
MHMMNNILNIIHINGKRSLNERNGFIAVTAVVMLASATLAFSLAALASALLYADSVDKRELRLQAGLNAQSCLDSAALMAVKDHFLTGSVHISELGCDAWIWRDASGSVSVKASASLSGVSSSILEKNFGIL